MSRFPQFAVTVDIVIFSVYDDDLKVLLIKRGKPPFQGRWALPGGFVEIEEPLEAAARRELAEETGVQAAHLEQLYTFGEPGRDPRGRTISVAYYALVKADQITPQAASDAAAVRWFSAFHPPRLAFDHRQILRCAVRHLQHQLEWTTAGFELLPRRFTLPQLQRLYEIIWQRPVSRRELKRKVLSQGELVEVGYGRGSPTGGQVRLYTFRRMRRRQPFNCGS